MRSQMSSSPTPSSLPRFSTPDEFIDDLTRRWMAEFEQKKAKWEQMSHEQRVAYIKAVFDRLLNLAQTDPQKASEEFVKWLISPDGALAWPYIWKPKYRQLMIDITAKAYQLAVKYLDPAGVLKQ